MLQSMTMSGKAMYIKPRLLDFSLAQITSQLKSYLSDATALTVANDPVRQKTFNLQLTGVTRGVRPLIPMALVLVGVALTVFWQKGDRELLAVGAIIISIAVVFARLKLLRLGNNLNDFAKSHLVVAISLGVGWAFLSVGITRIGDAHIVMMILWIQMGLIASGLVMYLYLPVAFLGFSLPIALPMTLMSARYGVGGIASAAPLTLLYLVVLALLTSAGCSSKPAQLPSA
jgi:hypothetical protein